MKVSEAITNRILTLCNERDITPNRLGTISGVEQIVTIKTLCDGLEITLFDFFNDELFKTYDLED